MKKYSMLLILSLLITTACTSRSGEQEFSFHVSEITESNEGYYVVWDTRYWTDSLKRNVSIFLVPIEKCYKKDNLLAIKCKHLELTYFLQEVKNLHTDEWEEVEAR